MTFAVFATIAAPFSVGFLALLGGFAWQHVQDLRELNNK